MPKFLRYFIPVLTATLFVAGLVWASTFPASLHNFSTGDLIEADDWNALEATIGITGSTVQTSHDWLIRARLDDWEMLTVNAIAPTSTIGIIVSASSTFTGYVSALGFTGKSSTTAEFAANPSDCSANQFANTIAASGNLTCAAIADADVPDTITVSNYLSLTAWYSTTTSDIAEGDNLYYTSTRVKTVINATNTLDVLASTATALAANGANCGAGEYPLGVNASGAVESCTDATTEITSYALSRSNWFSTTTQETIESLPSQYLYPAFTYTTTTWEGTTTTIPLGVAYVAETWSGAKCFTNTGTASLRFGDGTNKMNWIEVSTTVGEITLSTNNTFTASEKRYVEIGSVATSPASISCSIKKQLK